VEEIDIIELEKRYWQIKGISKSGYFDLQTLKSIASPPLPEEICQGVAYVSLLRLCFLLCFSSSWE